MPTDLHVPQPSLETIRERTIVDVPTIAPLTNAHVLDLASKLKPGPPPSLVQVLSLSARQPYAANGNMDVYMPGRWDTTYDLVFLDPIVDGPMVGEWTGTAVYATFKAPAAATYLIVANFSGYQTTMNLGGPWGTSTAYTAVTTDSGAATALWTGTAGETLSFGVTCSAPILGYLSSIQCFQT
jgi:hypothetical protein